MKHDTIIEQAKLALGINDLNAMQNEVLEQWTHHSGDMVVYSPTGSGKTLATAIPALLTIDDDDASPQIVIIAPSRELVLQTHGVLKKVSTHTSVTCCYGGHSSASEKLSLDSSPMVVVATPGRLLDHINRKNISLSHIKCLVLDEFDKSLELGFSDEMRAIMRHCPSTARKIMTSATIIEHIPDYVKLNNHHTINHLATQELTVEGRIKMWNVKGHYANKQDTLLKLLLTITDERTIVFANTRESAQQIFNFIAKQNMSVALYHGLLEQKEREKAVAMFNNGSVMVLIATDLAARGLDIADIKHIVHYDLPLTEEILTHRNGRTARVNALGEAYFLTSDSEQLPCFVGTIKDFILEKHKKQNTKISAIATIHISAGKKEKVSRGDIVGFLATNTPMLDAGEIGAINIYDHYALVAVPAAKVNDIINAVSPYRLKKQKVRLSIAIPLGTIKH